MQTISYTFLSTYKNCKRRAWLQFVKKVIPQSEVNCRNFLVGSVVDSLFESWGRRKFTSPELLFHDIKKVFDSYVAGHKVIWLNPQDRGKLLQKTEIAVQRLVDCVEALDFANRRIFFQYKSSFVNSGLNFFAKLDMLFPDENMICDLKVTQNKVFLDPAQLHFYSLVLAKAGVHVDKAFFLSPLMTDFWIESDVSSSSMAEYEMDLWAKVKSISAGDWSADPKSCYYCPVEAFCDGMESDGITFEKSGSALLFDL